MIDYIFQLSFPQLALVALATEAVFFFYVIFRIPQVPPIIAKRNAMKEAGIDSTNADASPMKVANQDAEGTNNSGGMWSILKALVLHLREGIYTLVRKRAGHRRLVLVLMFCSVFLTVIGNMGMQGDISFAFMLKAPIKFSTADITNYQATGAAMGLVGSIIGVVVLKRHLKFRDTTICVLAALSFSAKVVLFAFATGPLLLYLAQVAGCLQGLLVPTQNSVTAKLVNIDESGKAFALLGLAADISALIGGIIDNRLYYATVALYPPLTFLVIAGVLLINGAILFLIHVLAVKDKIET